MVLLIAIGFLAVLVYEAMQGAEGPWTIAGVASNAGFTGGDLVIAVAIAYAESSGNPNITGDNGNSIGLWQINLPNHPEYQGVDLTDPQTNANAAFAIYSAAGNSFTPWTTFKTGAYQANLPQATSDVGDMSADNSDDSDDDEEG
jgi:Lysozyme like domain